MGCLRRRDPAGGRHRRTRATQRPSIFASPRRDTLHVQRHAAPFLGNCTLDRLSLFFAAALLKRNVRAAEGRRRRADHGNAAGCIAALRLFLLFRRVAHCRVDLFQFVDEVAATEAVVEIGPTSDWAKLWGARGASR